MSTPCHALVFRDVRAPISLRAAGETLVRELESFLKTNDRESLVSALLHAGEAECALADRDGFTRGAI